MKKCNIFSENRFVFQDGHLDGGKPTPALASTPPPAERGNVTLNNNVKIVGPKERKEMENPLTPLGKELARSVAIFNDTAEKGIDAVATALEENPENVLAFKAIVSQLMSSPDKADPSKGGIVEWESYSQDKYGRRTIVKRDGKDLVAEAIDKALTTDYKIGFKLPKTEQIIAFLETLPKALNEAVTGFKVNVHMGEENWIGIPTEVAVSIKSKASEVGIKLPENPLLLSDVITRTDPKKFDEKLWKELMVLVLRKSLDKTSLALHGSNAPFVVSEKTRLDERSYVPDEEYFYGHNKPKMGDLDYPDGLRKEPATLTPVEEEITIPVPSDDHFDAEEASVWTGAGKKEKSTHLRYDKPYYVGQIPNPARSEEPTSADKLGVFTINAGVLDTEQFVETFSEELKNVIIELQKGNPEDLKRFLEYGETPKRKIDEPEIDRLKMS